MRHRKNASTSAVPGKRRAAAEDETRSRKRPEGTVAEHKTRMKRNHEGKPSTPKEYDDTTHGKN
jgi:hypothetical protein